MRPNDPPAPRHEPFRVEDPTDLLLLLLYAPGRSREPGEPVEGVTRLQKLMFLLQQPDFGPAELVKEAKAYGYSPYKMGPFSTELRSAVAELQAAGIIKTERLVYVLNDDADSSGEPDPDLDAPVQRGRRVESQRFRLTALGVRIGQSLWSGLSNEQREGFSEFKTFFNSLSLRQLLIFTYERFPAYTTASEIKDELGFA